MRICRYQIDDQVQFGFYDEQHVIPLSAAGSGYSEATGNQVSLPNEDDILAFLPPTGAAFGMTAQLHQWLQDGSPAARDVKRLSHSDVQLLVPVPRPNKLFLLAGNYAKHIEEGGDQAAERAETFPYVFMKPPTTTLTHPNQSIQIPAVSPQHIDWELELAIVIGKEARHVPEAKALEYVAGYTIINDISDREFRPNPQRKERRRDAFFDWLHGKWHDSFCPCGPCVATAATIPDPQSLDLKLSVNGKLHQDASTSQQVFPVAAVIEFVSNIVTLEPGDIISTGTPHGVGKASGTFLAAGDQIEASIGGIGTLCTDVIAEPSPG